MIRDMPWASRRAWLLGFLASGVTATLLRGRRRAAPQAAAAPVLPTAVSPAPAVVEPPCEAFAESTDAEALIAPLSAGTNLGPWRVERLLPLQDGASGLVLSDQHGVPFQLDICARDASADAPRPPASSGSFAVYLANGGEGETPSYEHHGLAAMAVAEIIRQNEGRLGRAGFRTLRERLSDARDGTQRSA